MGPGFRRGQLRPRGHRLGSGGRESAAQAAYFGKRVALVERAPHVGGAGINTGTVPSKTLRETALYFSGLKQRGLYGVDYSLKTELTVRNFMYREHEVVRDLRAVVERNLERHGIELVRGTAVFEDLHTEPDPRGRRPAPGPARHTRRPFLNNAG